MAVYGPGCHPQNIIGTEAKLRSIYYFVAMNYLLLLYEFGQNPEENCILKY
jgi:hypothetical protein